MLLSDSAYIIIKKTKQTFNIQGFAMSNEEKLLKMAQQAAANSYSPYSNFKVGAAILSSSGNFYAGCNVENISYPVGSCAEQSAISAMISSGDKNISTILIYADSKELITPCGACRQRIAEFSSPKTIVLLADASGIRKSLTIRELLPLSFSEF